MAPFLVNTWSRSRPNSTVRNGIRVTPGSSPTCIDAGHNGRADIFDTEEVRGSNFLSPTIERTPTPGAVRPLRPRKAAGIGSSSRKAASSRSSVATFVLSEDAAVAVEGDPRASVAEHHRDGLHAVRSRRLG